MTDDELDALSKHGNTPAIQNWAREMIELRQNLVAIYDWAYREVDLATIDKHAVQRAMSMSGMARKAAMLIEGK